jgi:hypothetical protein
MKGLVDILLLRSITSVQFVGNRVFEPPGFRCGRSLTKAVVLQLLAV